MTQRDLLEKLVKANNKLFEIIEQYAPKLTPGHICGPESQCDAFCMEVSQLQAQLWDCRKAKKEAETYLAQEPKGNSKKGPFKVIQESPTDTHSRRTVGPECYPLMNIHMTTEHHRDICNVAFLEGQRLPEHGMTPELAKRLWFWLENDMVREEDCNKCGKRNISEGPCPWHKMLEECKTALKAVFVFADKTAGEQK